MDGRAGRRPSHGRRRAFRGPGTGERDVVGARRCAVPASACRREPVMARRPASAPDRGATWAHRRRARRGPWARHERRGTPRHRHRRGFRRSRRRTVRGAGRRAQARAQLWAWTPRSGWSRSRAELDRASLPPGGLVDWAPRGCRATRPRPRTGGDRAGDARTGPAARTRTDAVRTTDRLVPGGAAPPGREPGRRSRRRQRCWLQRRTTLPRHCRHGQGQGRAGRPDGGTPLPTGVGRHRLHHRAHPPPLRPSDVRARPAPRRGQRAHAPTGGRRPGRRVAPAILPRSEDSPNGVHGDPRVLSPGQG